MTTQTKYESITQLISEQKLKQAFDLLIERATSDYKEITRSKLESLSDNYKNMLHYTMSGVDDPARKQVYDHLVRSMFSLGDQLFADQSQAGEPIAAFEMKELQANYTQKINETPTAEAADDKLFSSFDLDLLFRFISRNQNLDEETENFLQQIVDSSSVAWYEKSIVISALTLSLALYFDIRKFKLLHAFYDTQSEQIWQRAMVGLVIGFSKHSNRLAFYPEIKEIQTTLSFDNKLEKRLAYLALQINKALETEKLSEKLQKEIIPEIQRISPELREKLDLDSIINKDAFDDENPDWSNILSDSPELMDKLAEMSEMQLDGSDVFISTFAALKFFSFFNKPSNWFMPFHKENEEAQNAARMDEESFDVMSFLGGLQNTPFICNSDKYSFCLNLEQMPNEQKKMMTYLLQTEVEQMNEIAKDDDILQKETTSYKVLTQYIQDLYRYYKLFPNRNETNDIFQWSWDLHEQDFFKKLTKSTTIRKIAEFNFKQKKYEKALEVFGTLQSEEHDFELFQKMGFAQQKLKNYRRALDFYQKAELYNSEQVWNQRKIAFCYRQLKKTQKALDYYLRAETLSPDNLANTAAIGHCYLDLKEYDKALQYYFKVEYLAPDNIKVM